MLQTIVLYIPSHFGSKDIQYFKVCLTIIILRRQRKRKMKKTKEDLKPLI